MTTEIYLKFKDYEDKFQTVLHGNFVRFTTRELDAFNTVLKEHNGKGLTPSQRTCPHCLLTAVKAVANEYFKFKESPHGKKVEKQLNGNDGEKETGETEKE